MDIILVLKMGQSMQKPIQSLNRNSSTRLSARSLRSSNQSINNEKRTCFSASKCKINNQQPAAQCSLSEENTQIKNGQLFLMSRHQQSSPNLKQLNKLKAQRSGLGIENSQLSPNFKEIAEAGVQYGLPAWNLTKGNKQYLQITHNEPHNDITISFSQPKNIISSPFRQDSELRKSKLHQILEYQQENQKESVVNNHTENVALKVGSIDKRKQGSQNIYSNKDRKRQSKEITNKSQEVKKENILNTSDQFLQSADKIQQKNLFLKARKQSLGQSSQAINMKDERNNYNDYDCADFRRKIKEGDESGKKPIKISKKMQQLKQKIANKASNSKDKEQILKKSINRLSQSFRKYRQGHSLSNRSKDISQEKSKPVLSKITCFNITIQNHRDESSKKILKDEKSNDKQPVNTQKLLLQSKQSSIKSIIDARPCLKKMRSSQQLGKTTISSSDSTNKKGEKRKVSKITFLNQQNDYISQNLIVSDSQKNPLKSFKTDATKKKQPSFLEMVKKDHFGNGIKKKSERNIIQQSIKYSQIEGIKTETSNQHIFASTCEGNKILSIQEYEFFGVKQQKKKKDEELRVSKQQINSLKMITHQLTNKNREIKIKTPYSNQFSHNSSQEPSLRNKTYQHETNSFDKKREKFSSLNYTELNGRLEEYMLRDALDRQKEGEKWAKQQKKRYKSSQHSSKTNGVKSRLLAF